MSPLVHSPALPGRPYLSHVLASYSAEGFARAVDDIEILRDHGLGAATIVPTYHVSGSGPRGLTLDRSRTPTPEVQRDVFTAVLRAGLRLRVSPHLDPPHGWRARIALDPLAPFLSGGASYWEAVIEPTLEAMVAALRATQDDGGTPLTPALLVLGSELERSFSGWPGGWTALLERARAWLASCSPAPPRVEFGCNLNWDHHRQYRRNAARDATLRALDRVSISFYPPVAGNRVLGRLAQSFCNAGQDRVASALAARFVAQFERYAGWLARLNPRVDIGEAGVGSGDLSRPWHHEDGAFDGPDGNGARIARGHYWAGLLEALPRCNIECATIWSVGVYNVLGTAGEPWRRDEAVAGMVRSYNAGLSGEQGTRA